KLALTIVIITHVMEVVKEICNKVAVMEVGEVVEQGDLVSIFTSPKEKLTQEFINTATHIDLPAEKVLNHPPLFHLSIDDVLINITYDGETTCSPIIACFYSRSGITTHILYVHVENLQNTPIGNLIVVLSGEERKRTEPIA